MGGPVAAGLAAMASSVTAKMVAAKMAATFTIRRKVLPDRGI
jgi:hypothetical protein